MTGLKFDQQKKQVDRRLNADRVAEEKQKEQRIKKNRRQRNTENEVVCTGQDFAEDARGSKVIQLFSNIVLFLVTVLPIPKDLPREERHLLERATQELLREAAAFIKGRNAKKRANFGYELGANLNSDGTHRQGQTFVESNTQLQSVTSKNEYDYFILLLIQCPAQMHRPGDKLLLLCLSQSQIKVYQLENVLM